MMEEYENVMKSQIEDHFYKGAKAAVGMIPVAGSLVNELLTAIIVDPVQERTNDYIKQLGENVNWLIENRGVQIDQLKSNELFLDVVMQTTTYAMKTSEKKKRIAFKNIVKNTALNQNPDELQTRVFIRLTDSFIDLHINVLTVLHNPELWFTNLKAIDPESFFNPSYQPYGDHYQVTYLTMLKVAFIDVNAELLKVVWSDLSGAGLHQYSLNDIMLTQDRFKPILSSLGKAYIDYISFE